MERWVENPPEDYIQYIPLWVRISKIPVNYYTTPALMTLGEMIGEVKVLAFDPMKPITQDFIRVQVRFNVAKPLKMARVLDMGGAQLTKSTSTMKNSRNVASTASDSTMSNKSALS